MIKKIENTFWFRHFLLCNHFANQILQKKGLKYFNLALLIQQE
jgi:hypothetical protein